MKNLYYYLVWLWNKTDKEEIIFPLMIASLVVGLLLSAVGVKVVGGILVLLSMMTMVGILIKVMIVDEIKASYKKYKREQASTFNKLKKDYR